MRRVVAALALALLGGCSYEIGEADAFAPQPFDAEAARKSGDAMLGDAFFRTPADINYSLSDRGYKATYHWPKADVAATRVAHGRIGAGADSIAYTLMARVNAGANRPLIVRCLGNAGTRQKNGLVYGMTALPYGDVLLFDYPGSGETGGEASAERFEAMLVQVIDWARTHAAEENRKLVFWGHSLGGFVCGEMARRTPEAAGLVFETTARNAREVANEWTPWWVDPFVRIKVQPSLASYDNALAVKGFAHPVLVLGARKDKTLPVPLSRSLAKALEAEGVATTYEEFPEGTHNTAPAQPDFHKVMSAYFASLGLGASAP